MTLWQMKPEDTGEIEKVAGSIPEAYRGRISELGFAEGEYVTCIKCSPFSGPKVYQVGHGIYSLDREMAECIYIKSENQNG